MASLNGKVALITGVGHNIGPAAAQALAASGAKLALNDVEEPQVVAAARTVQAADTLVIAADIRNRAEVHRMVETVLGTFGRIDILVNNAGRSSFAPVLEMTEDAWDLEVDSNLKGTFLVSQAVAHAMVRQGAGGRIISLASTAAESARVGGASHCASKAGIVMLTKVMALELGQYGITANAVSPGLVPAATQASSDAYREAYRQMVPLGRLGRPADIAQAILFLASDAAAWVTGTVLHVDGGFLAGRALPPTGR